MIKTVPNCFLTLIFWGFLCSNLAFSQKIPIVKAGSPAIDVRFGDEFRKGAWNVDATVKPDVYDAYIPGKSKKLTFISDIDSISFDVKPGDNFQFIFLLNAKDSAFTVVRGIFEPPRAQFSDEYKKLHSAKTFIEIPPVYELINIAFAMTGEGKKNNGLIRKDTEYYKQVLEWFDPYKDEPVVQALNAELLNDQGNYHGLKMDAYAFELQNNKIIKSPVYDRIGFSKTNFLAPYIADLQSFSSKSKFEEFYNEHQSLYNSLIKSYRDSIGVPEMQKWLTRNFPSTQYDSFKIIFSLLVSGNQSATWFDYNDFQEAQAHVNFPGLDPQNKNKALKNRPLVMQGNIVFTELNHSFIGPEGQKPQYKSRIDKAFANLNTWNNPAKPAKYYNSPQASFDEYMNWALVSLRYVDYAPAKDQSALIADIEEMMKDSRGFLKFPEFNQYLVKLYKTRKNGQTVADLYTEIVKWFEDNK